MTLTVDEFIREVVMDGLGERAAKAIQTRVDAHDSGHPLPAGGTTNEVLAKTSNADYAAGWTQDPLFHNVGVSGALTHTGTTAGFYGHTPVTQHAAIADATDAGSAITQLNLALAALRSLGLIAT